MYTPEQEQRLTRLTETLLKNLSAPHDAEEAGQYIALLREVIPYHDWRYYVRSEAVISDADYDRLFTALRQLEERYPQFQDPDSPTQRVARTLTKEFPTVSHLVPMLSLENSYDAGDLRAWHQRVRELTQTDLIPYCVEPKLDGASISLIYENDRLVRGATRGDGIEGEDITPNVRVLRSLPLRAPLTAHGIQRMEIRGEVIIPKEAFLRLNEKRLAAGEVPFANARNAASGGLRQQDARLVADRQMEAIVYHISYAVDASGNDLLARSLNSHSGNILLLHRLGFKTPHGHLRCFSDIEEVIAYCQQAEQHRENYPYEIDGLVIKVDTIGLQERCGATSHHPRWAMAYKFAARQAITTLLRVEFQVGRTGTITPVAKLEPVALSGVTVSSISLFNEDFIREKDLRIGDRVVIERAGDVIPYVVQAVTGARTGQEKPVVFPKHCPSCQALLHKTADEANWRCVNARCPAQLAERLRHFASKDAMDIAGMGPATVEEFLQAGLLHRISDMYRLDPEAIRQLPGWRDKSVSNLIAALEASKNQPLHRLLYGLGIRYVGETTAKKLAEQVTDLREFTRWTPEQFQQIEDIGPKVAASLYDFFQQKENQEELDELARLGVAVSRRQTEKPAGPLSGKTFLFTGTLTMKRKEAEELVEKLGGTILSSVTTKLNYLVVGENPGSKLEKARKLQTVQILTEKEFGELVGKS
ncbi:MAG: NAD-dependent DNA ligase LigA [Chitinophagales bacterium]|nr:NAD-dependent DNA ligase LigA [Chitinophagales bacterium]MDW8392883.1 NAD-dependent DNA ligase LigA [Chitinophagales bacterium]